MERFLLDLLSSHLDREDNAWWALPTVLVLLKSAQAGLLNCHVANLEMEDRSLLSGDPDAFWAPAAAAPHSTRC